MRGERIDEDQFGVRLLRVLGGQFLQMRPSSPEIGGLHVHDQGLFLLPPSTQSPHPLWPSCRPRPWLRRLRVLPSSGPAERPPAFSSRRHRYASRSASESVTSRSPLACTSTSWESVEHCCRIKLSHQALAGQSASVKIPELKSGGRSPGTGPPQVGWDSVPTRSRAPSGQQPTLDEYHRGSDYECNAESRGANATVDQDFGG